MQSTASNYKTCRPSRPRANPSPCQRTTPNPCSKTPRAAACYDQVNKLKSKPWEHRKTTKLTGHVNQLLQIGHLRIPVLDVVRDELFRAVQTLEKVRVLDDLQIKKVTHLAVGG